MAARSGSGAKEMILMWVQNRIRDYPVSSSCVDCHQTHVTIFRFQ